MILGELASFGHYDLVANDKWLVYPYLGVGVNYARLTVSSMVSNANFQTSLANPGIEEVVQRRYAPDGLMLFGELGAGVERVIKLSDGVTVHWTERGIPFIYEQIVGAQGCEILRCLV